MIALSERLARKPEGYRFTIGRVLAIYAGLMTVLLLGETLSWLQIVGGVAIGIGIWLARRRRVRLVPGGE